MMDRGDVLALMAASLYESVSRGNQRDQRNEGMSGDDIEARDVRESVILAEAIYAEAKGSFVAEPTKPY